MEKQIREVFCTIALESHSMDKSLAKHGFDRDDITDVL
jgi:hypothetical protein